jgi:hypothetical protein
MDGPNRVLISSPPDGCLGVSPSSFALTFRATAVTDGRSAWPKAAIAVAEIDSSIAGQPQLKAYKFPGDYCFMQGTSAFCGDP